MHFSAKQPQSRILADELRNRIERGELKPGEALPSIRELSAMNGIGRQVVLSAFQLLADEGLVKSTVGRGTLVNPALTARTHCRIAFVIIGDNLENSFYSSVYSGLCRAAAGSGREIIPYEDATSAELEQITADCILLTGLVSSRAVKHLAERKQRCIVIGNYLPKYWSNHISFAVAPLVRELLMTDTGHSKSVGILIDSPSYFVSREIIEVAERYCQEYDLPWQASNTICSHTRYGLNEIAAVWGARRDWPERIVTTRHLFQGLTQYLTEQKIPPEKCPEILVTLVDKSFKPQHSSHFRVRFAFSNEADAGPAILQTTIDYITGRLKDGFFGEYDPIHKKLKIS